MSARTRVNAPLVFRLHENAPDVVREVLLERGWEEFDPEEQEEGDWNLYWSSSAFRSSDYKTLSPWQRLNHHPRTARISRKDCLARNLRRMRGAYGPALYDFSPVSFILPNDYIRFLEEYTKNKGKCVYWICKPADLSRGRGIFIFKDIKRLTYDSIVIVQKYISDPFLISGYKFDLRVYVCVTSFSPLTIYMHQEGLVRFATEKYDLASPDNPFSHLTNTSINKFGLFYATGKERVGKGCKWSISKFRNFLHSQDVNQGLLWQKISNMVTLTLLTVAPSVPSSTNCVELFGVDILIDSNLKPWLLEVNYSPALSLDCPVDRMVKGLINDLIDLMNFRMRDRLRWKCCLHTSCLVPEKEQVLFIPKHQSCSGNLKKTPSNLFPNSKTKGASEAPCHYSRNELADPELCELVLCSNLKHKNPKCFSSKRFRLPSIYPPKSSQKPPGFLKDQTIHDMTVPCHRVGDFILTYPFNEVTQKASQDPLDVRTIMHELHKLTSRLTSAHGDAKKQRQRRYFSQE
ncbi:putative tubulin polyglutamylase TTLL2 [Bagarius yarrelli]|uniref:Putative tubulin polyglutamylase TTLL2 n=1 Tax=Bagarius yarrelli TaxID=175774 RepID=A0A556VV72_BAGYA|nr:putative tubulin polyglutamylase TTLL2 [Bagarius yarrelli]